MLVLTGVLLLFFRLLAGTCLPDVTPDSQPQVNNALSSNLTLADDDDDSPAELANYESYNSNQTVLYQRMMSFWFIPTGLCLLLWLYQLRLFRAFVSILMDSQ